MYIGFYQCLLTTINANRPFISASYLAFFCLGNHIQIYWTLLFGSFLSVMFEVIGIFVVVVFFSLNLPDHTENKKHCTFGGTNKYLKL